MLLALILTFLKNAIYGASVFFTGDLSASVDVLDILALRFLMSFVVLFLLKQTKLVHISVGVRDLLRPGKARKHIKHLLLAALFEPVLYMLFETLGITMTTGITAGVILSLSPISSCICEEIFLKEKSTLLQKIFLAIGIAGVLYIAINTGSTEGKDSPIGILFILLAVICGSLFLVFSRKSSARYSAFEVTYVSCLLGALIFNAVNVVRHLYAGSIANYFTPYFDWGNLVGFVFLAVISAIIATAISNYAISKLQLSTVAAFGGVSTLVTVLIGVVRGEPIYHYHIIGLSLILVRMIGVSYISIQKSKRLGAVK